MLFIYCLKDVLAATQINLKKKKGVQATATRVVFPLPIDQLF